MRDAAIAQSVERILGKDEVASSNLASSSIEKSVVPIGAADFFIASAVDCDLIYYIMPVQIWGASGSGQRRTKAKSRGHSMGSQIVNDVVKTVPIGTVLSLFMLHLFPNGCTAENGRNDQNADSHQSSNRHGLRAFVQKR